MAELTFAERIGLDVLRRRIDRKVSHIHKWSDVELAGIERIERRTKAVAALAGVIMGPRVDRKVRSLRAFKTFNAVAWAIPRHEIIRC
jgi:hypothetical protein